MEISKLSDAINTIGYSGTTLSNEEIVVLQNSLLLLQNDNHFRKIYFWGRIFGIDKDYYVAYGYTRDVLTGCVYFYSVNGLDWGLLPSPKEHANELTPLSTTRFQGDPALVLDVYEANPPNPFDKDVLSMKRHVIKELKEEDRLSSTIYIINEEAAIVPRGALFKRPDGVVVENISFEGLALPEAKELLSYLHFRMPYYKWNTNLLYRPDYNYALDFLDTLDKDVPKGCWTVHTENGGQIAIVKPIYWPGMTFYHKISTPDYGFLYIGYGKKNIDVPFMLHTW